MVDFVRPLSVAVETDETEFGLDHAGRIHAFRHTGFNVHSLVRAKTKIEAERVGKYMIRPVPALERLFFPDQEGKVGYRYGEKGAEQETIDYPEFIARVTSHISSPALRRP